jgi:hypothetical protein
MSNVVGGSNTALGDGLAWNFGTKSTMVRTYVCRRAACCSPVH